MAERLQDPAPGAVGATWAVNGNPHGMPSWMSGDLAYKAGFALIAWLIDRASEVQELGMRDSEQHLFEMIRKLSARYTVPPIERPSRRRRCTVCGEASVVVDWVLGGTGEAVCRTCGATYAPETPGVVA
ncbi:hypothetical protein [Microbacterium sp. TPD7012]|uniref:hypothetical protein n=1 Tax=Microbacterium sp. TPD7012 TaxID=2171975 RepID=UPI0010570235|nr:hypothetical protein [Microbacterium sp. TPD7012]